MSDPLDVLAGEYVLGTLDAAERSAFANLLAGDADARAAVAAWEGRLAPLRNAGDEVAPHPATWRRIAAGVRSSQNAVPDAPMRALLVSRDRWRAATLLASTLAAAAVALAAVVALRPGAPARDSILVAAVNRGGDRPALMIRVDLATRRVTVRPVAAAAPPGRSLQLWAISAPAAPRSLGLVGTAPAVLAMPAGAGANTTFAVSVEPEGGSTTGGPTGPVIYSGQLVEE